MRKLGMTLLAALTLLGLCACGGGEAPFDVEDTPAALMGTQGVFSEELEALEEPILLRLYGFGEELTPAQAAGYASTGATAEEVSVFQFADQEAAQAAMELLEAHLAYQKEANRSYRPQEMPKLEKAVLERRGNTLLFLVCADPQAARRALG